MGVVFCLVPVQVLVLALVLVCPAAGYNLDQEHSMVFKGPHSSMFGYSVLLHRHNSGKWLLVGAPVANSSHQLTQSPGAIFRCNIMDEKRRCDRLSAGQSFCGKTCEPESDHQWLGVSLSRQPGENGGRVLACAHRWKNVYYSRKDGQNNKLPNGACFRYESDLVSYQLFIPCYKDHQRKFGEDYGSCQAGISNFLTQELIIVGAPGSSYWTGSVVVYNTSSNSMSVYQDDETGAVSYGSYLGYAVGAGHFQSPSSIEVVGGAPQYNQKGKAFIFSTENSKMLQVVSEVTGHELGSYFGSSLCVVDLNADGLSDLLVGAPMATGTSREEGRVYVYINQGEAQLKETEFKLTGSDAYAARFGETIADLGDLDDDGYPDVAVGAPQEDDLRGAVYIYNGRKEGISPKPSQRITGSSLGHDLKMFGQSLNSGIDIDDNGYNDVAVGAFLSDSAVVLRTRPVVQVKASLILPEHIDQRGMQCQDHKTQTVCINVTICFSVAFKHHRGAIGTLKNWYQHPRVSQIYIHYKMLQSQLNVLLCVYSFVTPKSFVFGDEDLIPADCYPEKFNYTFKVGSDVSLSVFSSAAFFPQILEQQVWLLKSVNNFQVVVEAVFSQKPSMAVKIFIIAVSLVLGLIILTALIWCLWKCGFFKRNFKKQEELNRDSWDYVPKLNKRESST
uniref:Integrin subunit alpha 4 n=1 Tax=Poecilia reticulata TaxID=8081 RepID=A0A3P9NB79_POERE